jgi:ribosome biogenesis GTPase A
MQRHRRKPYSGKKKKQYLQEKRARKQQQERESREEKNEENVTTTATAKSRSASGVRRSAPVAEVPPSERLRTVFEREPRSEVEARILQAKQPLRRVIGQPTVPESIYNTETVIPIPTRPPWNYNMTKEEVERQEREAFDAWLHDIYRTYPRTRLNYFEHNLEVWRQLWRVCETSDILCVLADIRHPLFHFPPSLYRYVVKQLGKPMVLLLTKADLVPRQNVDAWREYFATHFSGLPVAAFCSFHKQVSESELQQPSRKVKTARGRRVYNPSGVREFLRICQSFGIKKNGEVVYFADYTPPFMAEEFTTSGSSEPLATVSGHNNTAVGAESTPPQNDQTKKQRRRRRRQKHNAKATQTFVPPTETGKQKTNDSEREGDSEDVNGDTDKDNADADVANGGDAENEQHEEKSGVDDDNNDNNSDDSDTRATAVSDSEAESEVESDENVHTIKNDDEQHHFVPVPTSSSASSKSSHERPYVTIGLIGHPNVGKSSVINALKGKKVVSTSRTPGHTKWRQTIFLTPKLVLQDCPGLVFPALDVPKHLQVLCGIYPLSQLREPYSAVHYLAERVPVEEIYRLEKVYPEEPWSGWHICQAYAKKRGYTTHRGNFNGHRAGIEILKDVWDGRIVLYFLPYQTQINLHSYIDVTSSASPSVAVSSSPPPENKSKIAPQETEPPYSIAHATDQKTPSYDEEQGASHDKNVSLSSITNHNPFGVLDNT